MDRHLAFVVGAGDVVRGVGWRIAGRSCTQVSIAERRPVRKRLPLGGLRGLGISPLACSWEDRSSGPAFGIDDRRTRVEGCIG
jgi:hypothetical protein